MPNYDVPRVLIEDATSFQVDIRRKYENEGNLKMSYIRGILHLVPRVDREGSE